MLTVSIKCLDGPLEDEDVQISVRALKMYDELDINETETIYVGKKQVERKVLTGRKFRYMIASKGLVFIKEVK